MEGILDCPSCDSRVVHATRSSVLIGRRFMEADSHWQKACSCRQEATLTGSHSRELHADRTSSLTGTLCTLCDSSSVNASLPPLRLISSTWRSCVMFGLVWFSGWGSVQNLGSVALNFEPCSLAAAWLISPQDLPHPPASSFSRISSSLKFWFWWRVVSRTVLKVTWRGPFYGFLMKRFKSRSELLLSDLNVFHICPHLLKIPPPHTHTLPHPTRGQNKESSSCAPP